MKRQMKSKTFLAMLVIMIMVFSVLSACSGGNKNSEKGASESAGSTSTVSSGGSSDQPAQEENVELNFGLWGTADQVLGTQKVLDIFMEKHPTIKVKTIYKDWGTYWTWITTQAASKDLPDVYKISFAYVDKYAKLGAMKPLDDYIASSNFDLSDFSPAALDMHKSGGKQVSLPRDANTVVMYYNKDIFDKAKIEYPKKEMTWDEVLKIALKLTVDDKGNTADSPGFDPKKVKQWGVVADPAGMSDSLLEPQLWSNGAKLVDDNNKLALNSPEAMQVLEFFRDLTLKYHVNPTASTIAGLAGNPILAFGTGKFAMAFGGSWNAPDFKTANINFGTFMPPKFKEVKTVVQPAGYAMSPFTKKDQAAWTLISWLTGPEGQNEMAKLNDGIPANKQAFDTYKADDQGFDKTIYLEAQNYGISAPWYDGKEKLMWEYISQKLQLPLSGKGDLKDAVKQIEDLMK